MSKGPILQKSREELREVSEQLDAYLSESEQVFLETGAKLGDLQERAQRLVEASTASAAAAGGADADDPVARLDAGLSDLRRRLGDSREVLRESAGGLVRVLSGIDQLGQFRAEFQRVAVTLWALAISTRIENARAGDEGGGFETVVADVRRLGSQIEPKFEAVLARAHALRTSAAGALQRAQSFLERDADQVAAQVEATMSSMGALRSMRGTASGLGAEARAASERIAGQITSVLLALQMHDIARQMIEHVREELDGLGQADSPDAALAEVAALAGLQASQLGRARETLTKALAEIAGHLQDLARAAVSLSDQTRNMAELREGSSVFDRLDADIARASESLREQLSRERSTTSAMRRVSDAMTELGRFAKEIEVIGCEVKLIALNAQVQAEKTGDEGRALAVLARAIRELSVDVEQQTGKVSSVMGRIGAEARALGAEQGEESAHATATEGVVADMSAVLEALHAQHGRLLDGIETSARDGAAIHGEVLELARKLDEQAERAEGLREHEAVLVSVSGAAGAACGRSHMAAASARLRAAAARYTMEHERVVHRAMVPGGQAPAAKAPAPSAPSNTTGLGDNVELF